jgi:hypothetical protein
MRTGKLFSMVPAQSMLLFLLCAAGTLAFVFLVLLPSRNLSAELDGDIATLSSRIEEQKVLAPIFKNLLAKSSVAAPASLPSPAKSKLTKAEISQVPKIFQKMVESHGLSVKELALDVNTVADNSGRLGVSLTARGQFVELRGFLIELAALPYFDTLEEIEVNAVEGGEEIKLKILLARE